MVLGVSQLQPERTVPQGSPQLLRQWRQLAGLERVSLFTKDQRDEDPTCQLLKKTKQLNELLYYCIRDELNKAEAGGIISSVRGLLCFKTRGVRGHAPPGSF